MNLKDIFIKYDLDVIILIVSLSAFLIVFYLQKVTEIKYFRLYRKKINPDYPIFWYEDFRYLTAYQDRYLKIFIGDFYYWKIFFAKHKDKALNAAAKRTRFLMILAVIVFFINFLILSLLNKFVYH